MTADAFDCPRSVLVLGGTSDIGLAVTRRLVAAGASRVLLAGRDREALDRAAGTLGAARVELVGFEASEAASHAATVDAAFADGDIDLVVFAFGQLSGAVGLDADPDRAAEVAQVNYVAAVSMGLRIAERFRAQGHGIFVMLSSVAGVRVRRSNFVYGSTKAGFDGFSQGLGDALAGSGVRVVIVRPGFVHTAMTAGMQAPPFATDVERIAEAVLQALRKRTEVVWVPPMLRWVMALVRLLPRAVFRRLPL